MQGFVVWLTGLQGAGKSTIATRVAATLRARDVRVEVLDGDEVRANLSPSLGYGPEARDENTKRIAYVAKLLARNGVAVLCPVVAPERRHRERARAWADRFCEVHVTAPMRVLEERDPKGLYAKAKRGEIADLVGVHQPYEAPERAEITIDTSTESADASAARLVRWLERVAWVPPGAAVDREEDTYEREDEAVVKRRLEALGYL